MEQLNGVHVNISKSNEIINEEINGNKNGNGEAKQEEKTTNGVF